MVDPKKLKIEVDGLSTIKEEVVETARALKRLEELYKEAVKRGGRVTQNARNLLEQQRLQVKERAISLEDVREKFEAAPTGPERERIGRRLRRGAVGIQRIAAKAETVAGQAGITRGMGGRGGRFAGQMLGTAFGGGAMGQIGGAAMRGGPLIAGAMLAGMALKKFAAIAKQASDSFTKFAIEKIDVARSITGREGFVQEFFKNFNEDIAIDMRRFGFSSTQSLQFASNIVRTGGMRGATDEERAGNLAKDIMGSARITRFFGMREGEGAELIGRARRAGLGGEDLGGFLGGIGERARAGAPALRGRVGEFLSQAVDYLKTISTTLDKSEKRDAVNFFTRVMGGLAAKGAEFTGTGMRQMLSSVDQVLQSGQGIIGGTFGRFLTSKVAREGGTQIDILKELDKGIMADGGKVFQEMLREMKGSTGSLDNVAVILAGETKRKFTETQAFLEIVEGLDLETRAGLEEFKKRAIAFDPKSEADQIRAARAAQSDIMLKFGEAVSIFRDVSILLGKVAEKILQFFGSEEAKAAEEMRVTALTRRVGGEVPPGFARDEEGEFINFIAPEIRARSAAEFRAVQGKGILTAPEGGEGGGIFLGGAKEVRMSVYDKDNLFMGPVQAVIEEVVHD